jgi:AcrR family transcriptional regulator
MAEFSPRVQARAERMEEKHAARRRRIVRAAKTVFARDGLGAATMRGIASAAGVTTGAIYPHFETKDALYGAVLEETLLELAAAVKERAGTASAGWKGAEALRAFFDFYDERPDDLALGLYLHDGIGKAGLDATLNAHLNARLQEVLDRIIEAHMSDGKREAQRLTANGVSHIVGLLLMERTGRLKLFGMTTAELYGAKEDTA